MPPRPDPTPSEKQLELLAFIIEFIEANGYQPTQAEMAARFGVTKNAVQNRLMELAARGLIELPTGTKARERAIKLCHVRFSAAHVGPGDAGKCGKEGE